MFVVVYIFVDVDVVDDVVVVVIVVCVQVGDQKKFTSVKESTNCPYYNEVSIVMLLFMLFILLMLLLMLLMMLLLLSLCFAYRSKTKRNTLQSKKAPTVHTTMR